MKGDLQSTYLNVLIPANIRFEHYGTWEKVKLENLFTPVLLTLPLCTDL